MQIRQLEKGDRFDAYLISIFCFHVREEDPERNRKEEEENEDEDWGAFDDDGSLMARIVNNHMTYYLDKTPVIGGGIGAVSTLPQYRNKGAVKEIFKKLLPHAYERGEILSCLYPFSHAFYRKAGYETVTYQNDYEFSPNVLSHLSFSGQASMYCRNEPVTEYLKVYSAFAENYNFACPRDEKMMQSHLKAEKPYLDRKFSYLLSENGESIAYLIMKDEYRDPQALFNIEECAWTCKEGFWAILGFLGRFTADYGKIRLPLPMGVDLLRIIKTPYAYDIQKTTRQDFMVRVVNAQKALEVMEKPAYCDFTIAVTDPMIDKNNAWYHVTCEKVSKILECHEADICVSISALSQLVTGCISFDEALLRDDVTVYHNEEKLRKIFTEKKLFIAEHF